MPSYNFPVFLCFVNLIKIFDSIKKQGTIDNLIDDVSTEITTVKEDIYIYTYTTIKIKTFEGVTDDIVTNEGKIDKFSLTQISEESYGKAIKSKPGYRIGTQNITINSI